MMMMLIMRTRRRAAGEQKSFLGEPRRQRRVLKVLDRSEVKQWEPAKLALAPWGISAMRLVRDGWPGGRAVEE